MRARVGVGVHIICLMIYSTVIMASKIIYRNKNKAVRC